jgi:hypothetical protein
MQWLVHPWTQGEVAARSEGGQHSRVVGHIGSELAAGDHEHVHGDQAGAHGWRRRLSNVHLYRTFNSRVESSEHRLRGLVC